MSTNNSDFSLRGIVVGSTTGDDKKMCLKVVVLAVTLRNQRGTEWSYPHPSVVNIKVYPGNLTPDQVKHLSEVGTEALFMVSRGSELLVEDIAYATPHPVREFDEFVNNALKWGGV